MGLVCVFGICTNRIPTKQISSLLVHPDIPRPILCHSITPSDTVPNLGVTSDRDFIFRKHVSLTCRSCFYHIRDLRRIRGYISLSVARTIARALITSRLDYCNFLLYNIASKAILKL